MVYLEVLMEYPESHHFLDPDLLAPGEIRKRGDRCVELLEQYMKNPQEDLAPKDLDDALFLIRRLKIMITQANAYPMGRVVER